MIELYLFIVAFTLIVIILVHRFFVVKKEEKIAFKEKIAAQVEENKKLEEMEEVASLRDETVTKSHEARRQEFAKFKEEMRKADFAIAKKDFAEAKRALIQAMAVAEERLTVALKLGGIYMETEDFGKAEALYNDLLEEGFETPDIYENLGKLMVRQKAYKEAIQAYVRAVELDEKDDRKLVALGKLYQLMMRYGVAAECFRRAAEIKSREIEYLFLLAEACAADEDFENALFTYERILTIEPYNEKAKSSGQDMRLKMKEQEAAFTQ